ncbi:MAG: hypothetical protein SCALA702_24900 [Melioribacteraceae bacterium]|nr:MAG: hypothetical protein SCALA702_24900 [Melioribacteraceae bacterium]
MKIIITAILITGLAGLMYSQSNYGYDFEHFYQNSFTPVETSLSGMSSLYAPSAYSHTVNPAMLSLTGNRVEFSYNLANSFRTDKAKFRTGNINYSLGKYGFIGASYTGYASTTNYIVTTIQNPEGVGTFRNERDYFTLGYGYKLFDELAVGLSFNHVQNKIVYDEELSYQSFDLGVIYMKNFDLITGFGSRLIISGAFDNFIRMGDNEWGEEFYSQPISMLPQSINIGISKQFLSKHKISGRRIFDLNLQANYSDEINSSYFNIFTVGGEFTFWELLTLRYAHTTGIDVPLYYSGMDNNSKNTFGIGVKLPVGEFFNLGIPLKMNFDYGHSYNKYYDYFNNGNAAIRDINSFSVGISLN